MIKSPERFNYGDCFMWDGNAFIYIEPNTTAIALDKANKELQTLKHNIQRQDFLAQYILNRAGSVSDGIDIDLVIKSAQKAWDAIQ